MRLTAKDSSDAFVISRSLKNKVRFHPGRSFFNDQPDGGGSMIDGTPHWARGALFVVFLCLFCLPAARQSGLTLKM
jgi:hypothetical protein